MRIFNEQYDKTLKLLEVGTNTAYVPLADGVYRSVFSPVDLGAARRARANPEMFALVAIRETRNFAESGGYDVL